MRSSAASYTVQGDQRRGRGVVETLPVNDASGTRRRRLGSGGGTPPLATPPAVPGPSGRRATQARGRDAAAGRRLGQDRRPVPAAAPVLAAREDDMSRAGDSDASLAGGRHHRRRVNAEEAEIPEHPSRTSSVAARGGNRDGSRATRNGSDDGFGGWLEGSTSGVVVRQASGSWEAAGGGRSSPGDGGAYKAVGKGVNRGEGGRVGRARGALPKGNEPVLPSESAEEVSFSPCRVYGDPLTLRHDFYPACGDAIHRLFLAVFATVVLSQSYRQERWNSALYLFWLLVRLTNKGYIGKYCGVSRVKIRSTPPTIVPHVVLLRARCANKQLRYHNYSGP